MGQETTEAPIQHGHDRQRNDVDECANERQRLEGKKERKKKSKEKG